MNRNKKFVLDSIKMDLFRVVTATGDITKEIPMESVVTFIKHADKDFDKIDLTDQEKMLRGKLKELLKILPTIQDPKSRLRWAEDVMTTLCML
jgi:hypothetical protein